MWGRNIAAAGPEKTSVGRGGKDFPWGATGEKDTLAWSAESRTLREHVRRSRPNEDEKLFLLSLPPHSTAVGIGCRDEFVSIARFVWGSIQNDESCMT
jgi:hypothetical protein